MNKTTYILSGIDKAVAFEWIVDEINREKIDLSFILLHNSTPFLYDWLKNKNITVYYLPHTGKKSYFINFFKIVRLLKIIRPDVVHCHLRDANLLGLSAAKLTGVKKRIYTRHHSTFHHTYHPQAVKYDKYCNTIATDIVAISQNVKNVLIDKEHVPYQKVHLIHHGFKLSAFRQVSQNRIDKLKQKYKITSSDNPVIGVISRYINWKGYQYIIPAFKTITKYYPNVKFIIANANGPDKSIIQNLLKQHLSPAQYIEIKFEPDLFALYQLFDVFVHAPINPDIEAFGQTYVEALVAGVPSVFTLSGVAKEFIEDKKNALVVPFKNSEAIASALLTILKNKALQQQLIKNGLESVQPFNSADFVKKLETLYLEP